MRPRWQWSLPLAMLVLGGAAAWFLARPDEGSATRVTRLPPGTRFYGWISEHDVFCVGWRQTTGWFATRLALESARQTPIPSIERILKQAWPQGEFHVSPDGRRILWTAAGAWQPGSPRNRYYAVVSEIDGRPTVDDRPGDNLAWTRDGKAWLRLTHAGRIPEVQVHGLTSRRMVRVVIKSLPDAPVTTRGGTLSTFGGMTALGCTREGGLLAANPHLVGPWQGPVSHLFESIDLGVPERSRRYTVAGPSDCSTIAISLSPQGDRLAWHVLRFGPPRLISQVLAWLHLMPLGRDEAAEIWVSHLDGTELRRACRLLPRPKRRPMKPNEKDELSALDVQWSPDGRRLSFVRDGGIYTVPVP